MVLKVTLKPASPGLAHFTETELKALAASISGCANAPLDHERSAVNHWRGEQARKLATDQLLAEQANRRYPVREGGLCIV